MKSGILPDLFENKLDAYVYNNKVEAIDETINSFYVKTTYATADIPGTNPPTRAYHITGQFPNFVNTGFNVQEQLGYISIYRTNADGTVPSRPNAFQPASRFVPIRVNLQQLKDLAPNTGLSIGSNIVLAKSSSNILHIGSLTLDVYYRFDHFSPHSVPALTGATDQQSKIIISNPEGTLYSLTDLATEVNNIITSLSPGRSLSRVRVAPSTGSLTTNSGIDRVPTLLTDFIISTLIDQKYILYLNFTIGSPDTANVEPVSYEFFGSELWEKPYAGPPTDLDESNSIGRPSGALISNSLGVLIAATSTGQLYIGGESSAGNRPVEAILYRVQVG